MTTKSTSSPRDLTLEDDGLEIVEPTSTNTTSNQSAKPTATRQPSPASTDASDEPDTVTYLLQRVGYYAKRKLRKNGLSRAHTCPHLRELTKLADYPNGERPNLARADRKEQAVADPLSSSHFQPDYFRQESKEEKVMRVWIPLDPNENPHPLLQNTSIPSIHHWSRASILNLLTSQIAATRQVFNIMTSHPDRYPTASKLQAASILSSLMDGKEEDPFKKMRKDHAILALRLKGCEVCEWVEEFERVEVYWEDVEGKMGMGDMKRFLEGEERNARLYGGPGKLPGVE